MKFYLESYGCTLNHGEARYLKRLLLESGHQQVQEPDDADTLVIFTCTVIRTTELKMLRQLRKFKELEKPVIVSGCMAVVQKPEVLNIKPDTYFIPPKDINKIHLLLDQISEELSLPLFPQEDTQTYLVDQKQTQMVKEPIEQKQNMQKNSIDSIVPIATGCRGKCTYCITRLARGELRSFPEEQILNKIKESVNTGHFEIRLTAQDTACYGYDSNNSLAKLLASICALKTHKKFKVRVGMMNPDSLKVILDELIEIYRNTRIFKFLHIPVQSGDNKLLAEMGRNYTIEEFFYMVAKFRDQLPKLTISTDVIIGYPTESVRQFENSLELIERLKPNIVNITRFSARPNTPAYKLKNTIPGREVKSRSRKLTELRFEISRGINEKEIGNTYNALITERVKSGTVLARNDYYTPIVVKKELPLGNWGQFEIYDSTDSYLIGAEI